MCFYHDPDWYASVTEETTPVATKPFRCEECGVTIQAGESYYHLYQQEREECMDCEEGLCSCVDWEADEPDYEHACKCEKPNYGEDYTYRSCHDCRKFLEAVAKHERDEGCRADESRPSLGGMIDELQELEPEHLVGYFATANQMYPELAQSGYLERIKTRIVGE